MKLNEFRKRKEHATHYTPEHQTHLHPRKSKKTAGKWTSKEAVSE
jgi:hypothetical protein